jgi:hypothetical protein
MEIVRVLMPFWRRRLALAPGLALAVVLAALSAGAGAASTGVAFTRVALDTPRSQLVASAPAGAGTLAWRAALLAHLAASEPVKRDIARRARIRGDRLEVVDPALALPAVPASLPKDAAEVAAIERAPYVLSAYLTNGRLPIISVAAAAPDRRAAARLAAAAADSLEAEGSSVRRAGRQPFVVQSAAPVHARTLVTRSGPVRPVAIALVAFAAWCAGVAFWPRLRPRLRAH